MAATIKTFTKTQSVIVETGIRHSVCDLCNQIFESDSGTRLDFHPLGLWPLQGSNEFDPKFLKRSVF